MKNSITRMILPLALSLLLLGGCEKNKHPGPDFKCPVHIVEGSEDNLAGKWKLVKGDVYSSTKKEHTTEDYSCGHTVYDFDAVGNLTVSGDVGSAMIFDSGEHNYQIAKSDGADETVGLYVLTLADKHYAVKLSSTDLLIEMNPIDPLALYESKLTAHFVRIE